MAHFGVEERKPTRSESQFFRQNPNVAGMAASDNSVVLNPVTPKGVNPKAVALNESARIFMRLNPEFQPNFALTPEQSQFLDSTIYRDASPAVRSATIAGRLLSGDPSAGGASPEQRQFIVNLRKQMLRMHRPNPAARSVMRGLR
jgi:hypothetical protein